MAIEPVHCDSSSILKVLFFGTTCMFSCIYVCVCLSQAETLSPFSSRSESQVKIAKRLCVCAFVHVCVSLYLCLCLFVSAPSRLDLRVRWRLQNLFVCVYLFVLLWFVFLCLCLFVSAPSRLDLRVRWRLQNLNEGRFLRTRVVMAAAHRNRALQKWNHHSYRTIKQSSHRKSNGKNRRKHWLHNYSTTLTCLCLWDYVDICKYNAIKCSCATDVWSPRWQ